MVEGNPPAGGVQDCLKSLSCFIVCSGMSCAGSSAMGCCFFREAKLICVGTLFLDDCWSRFGLELERMLFWS